MKQILLVALCLAFSGSIAAEAAPCRDAKGKFVTCPPVAAKKCRDGKGRFIKCSPSAAQPS